MDYIATFVKDDEFNLKTIASVKDINEKDVQVYVNVGNFTEEKLNEEKANLEKRLTDVNARIKAITDLSSIDND